MTGEGNVIERQAANEEAFAPFGKGVWKLVVVAGQGVEDIRAERRAREDAAIDAEDILTQAAEANALDPVG